MAIGVRISSRNLNGKTATVSFVPVSGMTSGSTENLGTKTIPFNNVNEHPYGVYTLNFLEYDYTYTLNVSQPYGENQSFVNLSTISGDTTNWATGVLNFDDLTATVIDLSIPTVDWGIWDIYPFTESGYMYVFFGRGQYSSNEKLVVYTNNKGEVIEQYSGTSSNYGYDILEGIIGYFAFENLGILKYSDGKNVYTFNWFPGTNVGEFESFDIEWDWDGCNVSGQFIFTLTNWTTGERVFYLADHGSHTLLTTSNVDTENKYFSYQAVSNFFMEELSIYGVMQHLNIWGSDGTLLQHFTFNNTYISSSYEHYGNNQLAIVYWNGSDDGIDYYIITYNGNTNQYQTTTHVRGVNYPNIDTRGDSSIWNDSSDKSSMVIILYSNTDDYSNLSGYTVSYLDFIYTLDNSETMYTETYQDSGVYDKSLDLYFGSNKRPLTYGNTGNGNISTIQLTPSGLTYNSLGALTDFSNGSIDNWRIGRRNVIMLRENGNDLNATLKLISEENTTSDTLLFYIDTNLWNYDSRYSYGVFYITNYTDGWTFNENSTTFIQLTGATYNWSSNSVYYNFEHNNLPFIGFNSNTGNARVFDRKNLYPNKLLNSNNESWNLYIGKDRYLYVYGDPSDNHIHAELIDFNGNIKNSLEVPYTSWYNSRVSKDRYIVTFLDSGNYYLYMITDNDIKYTVMSDYDTYNTINDIIWWND